MKNISTNFQLIKKKIKDIFQENNIPFKKVKIIAVSKNQNINTIEEAISLGIKEFGENYIQESIKKIEKLKKYKNITWHFIGKIQSKKTKKIAQYFDWCQTVDREKIIYLLNQHRPKNLSPINVLIQINISQEPKKNGVNINDSDHLAKIISLMPNMLLRGIMAMPSKTKNIIKKNIEYKALNIKFNQLQKKYTSMDTLSLGTSFDIKESLLAQSNMIRIGRAIFNQ